MVGIAGGQAGSQTYASAALRCGFSTHGCDWAVGQAIDKLMHIGIVCGIDICGRTFPAERPPCSIATRSAIARATVYRG